MKNAKCDSKAEGQRIKGTNPEFWNSGFLE
jgi:hypothetical protein